MLGCQVGGELDVVLDNKVTPLARLLGDWHSEARVGITGAWLRRPCLVDLQLLSVNGCDCALPACQGLLELQVDIVDDIITLASVECMFFLSKKNVSISNSPSTCSNKVWQTYLFHDKDQILLAALLLVAHPLEADLAALLQTRLDGDLENRVGSGALS